MRRPTFFLRTAALLLCAVLSLCAFLPVALADNHVPTIDMTVQLATDGSARITQVWTGSFEEGTEVYVPIQNLGQMQLSDFAVSGATGAYTLLPEWDVDASFEEKAYKCGIVTTDDGYEMCFGISEYGENTYTFSYTISGLVGAYGDADGFLFQFINPGMSVFPSDVSVRILPPEGVTLSDQNSGIWAFGYYGDIHFDGNGVLARSSQALDGNASCIVMLELEKGVLSPTRAASGTFAAVKEEAFKGSDYGTDADGRGGSAAEKKEGFDFFGLLTGIAFGGGFLLVIGLLIRSIVRRIQLGKFTRNADYYRDIPNGGSLPVSYALADAFHLSAKKGSVIGAALLRLIEQGCIVSVKRTEEGFLGREKETVDMQLVHEPNGGGALLTDLYIQLHKAAGEDGVTVTQKSLKKTVRANYEAFNTIIDGAKLHGEEALSKKGCYVKGAAGHLAGLTDKGREQLLQLIGFKKYLTDFSLIAERSVCDVALWKEYLVYAVLLDIADKAVDELKKAYPEQIEDVSALQSNLFTYYIFSELIDDSIHRAEAAARSAGSGGSSSFGGGGGFSGGGFGGGTR